MVIRELPPREIESTIARESTRVLSRYVQQNKPLSFRIIDSDQPEPIELPAGAVKLLMSILELIAAGQGITIIPESAELTTVQTAEILNVSRPFLIKLLEDGRLPYRKVGKHRRIRMEDVMSFKQTIDREREQVLDQLASDAQEQNMGYQ